MCNLWNNRLGYFTMPVTIKEKEPKIAKSSQVFQLLCQSVVSCEFAYLPPSIGGLDLESSAFTIM